MALTWNYHFLSYAYWYAVFLRLLLVWEGIRKISHRFIKDK